MHRLRRAKERHTSRRESLHLRLVHADQIRMKSLPLGMFHRRIALCEIRVGCEGELKKDGKHGGRGRLEEVGRSRSRGGERVHGRRRNERRRMWVRSEVRCAKGRDDRPRPKIHSVRQTLPFGRRARPGVVPRAIPPSVSIPVPGSRPGPGAGPTKARGEGLLLIGVDMRSGLSRRRTMGRRGRRRGGRPTSIPVGIVCLPSSVPPLRSIRGCRRRRRRLNDGGKSIGHEPCGRSESRPSPSGPRLLMRFFDTMHFLVHRFDL